MVRLKATKFILLVVFFFGFFLMTASAEIIKKARTEVELVTDVSVIQPGRPLWVALRMKMDDHWHSYWKNPGDSGLATTIAWDLPQGFEAGEIQWPFPKRVDYAGGLTSYIHDGEVFLMSKINAPKELAAGSRQTLKARVNWLVCEDICIPGKADLSLVLSVKSEITSINPRTSQFFAKAIDQWPITESEWQIGAFDANDYFRLYLTAPEKHSYALTQVAFFPHRGNLIDHAAQQTLNKIENGYELVIPKSPLSQDNIRQLNGVLVSKEGWQGLGSRRALSIDVPVKDDGQ